MLAPQANSSLVSAWRSARLMPGAGSVSSAEPPPEISAITRSRSVAPSSGAAMRRAPSTAVLVGDGVASFKIEK